MKNFSKIAGVVLLAQGVAWAGFGVTSPFGKVRIGGIEPGRAVRISSIAHPITVTNTSDTPVTLTLRVTRPKQNEVEPGFEPIPSVIWAVLEKNEFSLAPGQSATTDMILKPSLSKKYREKNYQVHVLSRAVGAGNVRIVMVHKLQFSVSKEEAVSARETVQELKMDIKPQKFDVKNLDLGRLSMSSKRALVVRNVDDVAHRYRVRTFNPEASWRFESFAVAPITASVQNGKAMTVMFDEFLPRNWVSLGIKEFELAPGESRSIPLKVYVPNHDTLKKRKMMALVRVTQLDGDFSSIFVPIAIETTAQAYAEAPLPEFKKPVYVDVYPEMAK